MLALPLSLTLSAAALMSTLPAKFKFTSLSIEMFVSIALLYGALVDLSVKLAKPLCLICSSEIVELASPLNSPPN